MAYECPTHHTWQEDWCPDCITDMDNARDPSLMTGDERAAEMQRWEIATVPFPRIHERLEELVGRPIKTLELAPRTWGALVAEARAHKLGDGRKGGQEQ